MKQIVTRRNKLFVIDKSIIKDQTRKEEISNALYAAIYNEFRGASTNPTYKEIPYKEMLIKVNDFANEWLKKRGLV